MAEKESVENTGDASEPVLGQVADSIFAIRKALAPGAELNKRLEETLQPFREAARKLQPFADAIYEFSRRMEPLFLALQRFEKEYGPQVIAFVEALHRFEEFNAGLVERHEKETLALPPFFNEFDLAEIVRLFADRSKPALTVYDEFLSKRENVDALLASWSGNRFYEDRMPILRDALDAHLVGKHTLSIPVFLAQIEGILCEIFEVRDHAKVKGRLNKIRFDPGKDPETPFASARLIAHIITEQVFQSSDAKKRDMQYPNRHPVLHGTNPFYYMNPHASLRCILLLDLLREEKFIDLKEK